MVVAIGAAFGFHVHAAGLLLLCVVLALLMATMAAFSIATALTTRDINGFAAVINGLNLPVLLLGGVLLPISLGPDWMRVLAHVNPLYYAVTVRPGPGGRHLYGAPAVWQAFAVLVPLCAVVRAGPRPWSAGPWPDAGSGGRAPCARPGLAGCCGPGPALRRGRARRRG